MEIIAFVGPSGTGKSHRAQLIAHENDIPAIIDDGLLIYANKIVAGKSAKKEENRLKAVRRAIFQDRAHVAEVKEAIDRLDLKKIHQTTWFRKLPKLLLSLVPIVIFG